MHLQLLKTSLVTTVLYTEGLLNIFANA